MPGVTCAMFEGLCCIGVGIVHALFFALAIKGWLIMGGMTFQGGLLALMLVQCVAAGAIERLVPALDVRSQEVTRFTDLISMLVAAHHI